MESRSETNSLANSIASLERDKRVELISHLSDEEILALLYDWDFWCRPKQIIPSWKWNIWLILAGRGFGKTRTGAETVRKWEQQGVKRIALVGETPGDVRDVMLNGPGGIMNIYPPEERPEYYASRREVRFKDGGIAKIYSAANPDALRGPEHEKAWADEVASWKYPKKTWDNLLMGLRLGEYPQVVATTTPRPIPLIRALEERGMDEDEKVHLTRGSTFENKDNLPAIFLTEILKEYEGTKLGEQELYARVLSDTDGALWKQSDIKHIKRHPSLQRIVVAIDPASTNNKESDETGIVVAGLGVDGCGYVLADLTTKDTPKGWAKQGINGYHKYEADVIIGETNNGGDMIETVIHTVDDSVGYKGIHASRGKFTRAEPVSSLYEQHKVFHIGTFPKLEDEMTTWTPDSKQDSPNRMDALVWAITELMVGKRKNSSIFV